MYLFQFHRLPEKLSCHSKIVHTLVVHQPILHMLKRMVECFH